MDTRQTGDGHAANTGPDGQPAAVADPGPTGQRLRGRFRRPSGAHDSRDGGATLRDVADRAGVSMTTASRVVNEGARKAGPEMAERVNRAVTELGYQANLQARAVASGHASMIGVMVRDIDDPYFSSIAAGLMEATDTHQLLVCISSTSSGEQGEREYVALMRAQRARAVVLIGSRSRNTAAREALRRRSARSPAPAAGFPASDRTCSASTRSCRKTRPAQRRLARAGRARTSQLRHPGRAARADHRARPGRRIPGRAALLVGRCRPALADRGSVHPRRRLRGDERRTCGRRRAAGLRVRGERRDGRRRAGAAVRAAGISVPSDIALAGFDDILALRDVYPPLTTVRLPLKHMGEMAASLVLGDASPARPRIIPVPGEVILRQSTLPRGPGRPR